MALALKVKGTRYEPTKDILAQAEAQIWTLDRFLSGKARAELELAREVGGQKKGDVWRAELMVVTLRKRYRATSTKAKLDHAITTVARDVARELARAKKAGKDRVRKGAAKAKASLRRVKR